MSARDFDSATLVYGIGAPRTGTKWMSHYFYDHPQVLMSPLRVLHYFDARYETSDTLDFDRHFEDLLAKMEASNSKGDSVEAVRDRVRMKQDPGAYLDYFRKRWTGERAFADITPRYYDLPAEAFAEMETKHPATRFIFVMRNPIDRMWSGAKMARTRDPSYDPTIKFDRQTRVDRTIDWSQRDYVGTIKRLEQSVPPEQVGYFFFEDLFNEKSIRRLCDFIGVDYLPAQFDTPQNSSDPLPLDEARRANAARFFLPMFDFLSAKFGDQLPAKWVRDIALARDAASHDTEKAA